MKNIEFPYFEKIDETNLAILKPEVRPALQSLQMVLI